MAKPVEKRPKDKRKAAPAAQPGSSAGKAGSRAADLIRVGYRGPERKTVYWVTSELHDTLRENLRQSFLAEGIAFRQGQWQRLTEAAHLYYSSSRKRRLKAE